MDNFFEYFSNKNRLVMEAFGAYLPSALTKIQSYLERELGIELVKIGDVDHFRNNYGSVSQGQKYVIHNTAEMIRLNFTGSGKIESLDIWKEGAEADKPSFNITVEDASVVQVLPEIAELLKKELTVATYEIELDEDEFVQESMIQESGGKLGDILDFLGDGPRSAAEIRKRFNQYALKQIDQINANVRANSEKEHAEVEADEQLISN